jgi:hypothetical protein
MSESEQQKIRHLAETLAQASDPRQKALAQGALELLNYAHNLSEALQHVIETCCDAMENNYPGEMPLHPQPVPVRAQPPVIRKRPAA